MSQADAEANRSVHVLRWTPMHMRWWDEEEIIAANAQGKFANGEEDYREVAQFHTLVSRYGGRGGGCVRRDSDGNVEVLLDVNRDAGLVVRICDTSSPRR